MERVEGLAPTNGSQSRGPMHEPLTGAGTLDLAWLSVAHVRFRDEKHNLSTTTRESDAVKLRA